MKLANIDTFLHRIKMFFLPTVHKYVVEKITKIIGRVWTTVVGGGFIFVYIVSGANLESEVF